MTSPPFDHLPVPGGSLAIRTVGEGPDLVVLHGGPGLDHRYLVRPLERLLADRSRLVFYDQRGAIHSPTDSDDRLTMATYVDDLDAVRAHLGHEAIDLMGHSFGGLLGMCYAIRHPERVRSLILVDPDPASLERRSPRVDDTITARLTETDGDEIAAIRSNPDWQTDGEAYTRFFRIVLRTYVHDRSHADEVDIGFDDATLAAFHHTYTCIRKNLGLYDIHDELPAITCPVLILQGASSIFSVEGARALADRIPDSTLVVLDGVGHFPFIETPDRFTAEVRQFLQPTNGDT